MADEPFQIYDITAIEPDAPEPMGTKEKYWLRHPELGPCLFKKARENTGEDWAEKVAAHLADRIGLPHAEYELAICEGTRGIIAPSFLSENSFFIPGNEVLGWVIRDYPRKGTPGRVRYRIPQHTVSIVLDAIDADFVQTPRNWQPRSGLEEAPDVFVGYLLLDAWIAHSDRHDENWGLIVNVSDPRDDSKYEVRLAPTFDHASSLGRNEPDERKAQRLSTSDRGFSVRKYALEKCRSALYARVEDIRPLTPMAVK